MYDAEVNDEEEIQEETGTDLPPDGIVKVVDVEEGKQILRTLKNMLLVKLQSSITRKVCENIFFGAKKWSLRF